jgi:hypothetical protein
VLVADELEKLGVDPRVLRPMGCGSFEPVKTGVYDAAGLRLNRRVEVFTMDSTAGDYEQVQTVPATGAAAQGNAGAVASPVVHESVEAFRAVRVLWVTGPGAARVWGLPGRCFAVGW